MALARGDHTVNALQAGLLCEAPAKLEMTTASQLDKRSPNHGGELMSNGPILRTGPFLRTGISIDTTIPFVKNMDNWEREVSGLEDWKR